MTWAVLDASSEADRNAWIQLWTSSPGREVAAHPSFQALFAKDVQKVLCATWSSASCTIMFPFLLRRIGEEAWAGGLGGWDLEGSGYAGPLIWGRDTSGVEPFWAAYDRWATALGLVAGFARLSLFSDEVAPLLRGEAVVAQMNVIRDLHADDDALLKDYAHKVRKNVNRARANGVTIEFDQDCCRLDEFLSIYTSTMDRREADDQYYYEQGFFHRLCAELRGQYVFAHALLNGRVVSTELVLLSATRAYSFLGGTRSDSFHLRPNDLLKHEVALWARDRGRTAYILGGGYGGEDGIYRYKKSFAPCGERPFRVWRHVADPSMYSRLVRARRDAAPPGSPWMPREGFFPAYRG